MNKIVIIGGGFAGVNLATALAGKSYFHVTVVDRNNYNFFPPLLYQVATGYLSTPDICYPYRKLWRNKANIRFHMAELKSVIPADKKIILSTGEMSYDILVLATGTKSNYFGMENIEKHAKPMKTLNDALSLRNYVLQIMEKASRTLDIKERKKLLTIVVAGAGPTGVEVSGMLAEMKKRIMAIDYPELKDAVTDTHIYLVDAAASVLPSMSKSSQDDTYNALINLGVEIMLNKQIKDYDGEVVSFSDGQIIESKTLVWGAGVTSSVFEGIPQSCYGRGHRLVVDEYNKVKGIENIYAIGDTCLQTTDAKFPGGHPQLAQPAIQQGKLLARNLVAQQERNKLHPFSYYDKGTMAIIGWNKAVADLPKPKLHFKGFLAWCAWMFVHLLFLINYRNRIRTFYNWINSYFSKDQSLRMIIRPESKDS